MSAILKWCSAAVVLFMLTGCWDSKTIQNMAYVTALGLDYQNGRYIAYIQVLNFTNVARSEKLEIGKSTPVWIGRGEGKTMVEALTSIYQTSQLRVYWGHIKAVICTGALLNNKNALRQAYDAINRYPEVRYNVLLYGTKDRFLELLSNKSIFNLSSLDSLMDSPEETFAQRSMIQPQYGYRNIAQLNEKGRTIILPTLTISNKEWHQDQMKKGMYRIDGAFAMKEQHLSGWYSEDDLKGLRWINKITKQVYVMIPDAKKPTGALFLTKPHHRIQMVAQQGEARFNLYISVKGSVEEMAENVSVSTMQAQAAQVVLEEIRATYMKGFASQTDLLNLFGVMYRNQPKLWHRLNDHHQLVLKEDTLKKIDVHVKLTHTGKYKGRVLPD
ncbi:Ger(x)C family spore germination protein [Paenibacillus sp. R14(2021)]|uniref:Ger(x)C family spore germination protein n=1 Tax=Paenibacillus sp. R14(2021) TaxID=2859228 RepID=UPI001C6162BA|nr:Ger(x)C family spore germination protein [Paenibacillus sp. R14(2021)]